ncbi:hypothetical protein [Streptomyces canus]|uniref:hypothetical protein n=1 Tax=Streptomyces canus TaxID=58343 RepID=UPI0033B11CDA
MRMWELATRASPTLSLRNAAMPFMEGVHDVVGHHVQLAVLDGGEVLFLERLTAPGAVINYTRIAGRLAVARLLQRPGPTPRSGNGCGNGRSWRVPRSTRRSAGVRRCRPSSVPRPPTSRP